MKIYTVTDSEGPAMVSRFAQTRGVADAPEAKREAMALLTAEVNARRTVVFRGANVCDLPIGTPQVAFGGRSGSNVARRVWVRSLAARRARS